LAPVWQPLGESSPGVHVADQVPYSQHSIFFVTYEFAQLVRLFHKTKLEMLTSDKNSNLLGSSKVTNKMKCCEYAHRFFGRVINDPETGKRTWVDYQVIHSNPMNGFCRWIDRHDN
jgi:hypothetical protein